MGHCCEPLINCCLINVATSLNADMRFPPYQSKEQSVISISKVYEVTEGSIYQLEQAALKKLNHHLESELL